MKYLKPGESVLVNESKFFTNYLFTDLRILVITNYFLWKKVESYYYSEVTDFSTTSNLFVERVNVTMGNKTFKFKNIEIFHILTDLAKPKHIV